MNDFNRFRSWAESHADVCLDIVRIYLGIGLLFKGLYFMTHSQELMDLMNASGNLWFAPAIVAHYVIAAHVLGGILLAIGLLTRAAAFFQIPILFGAVFYVHIPKMMSLGPRQDLEFSALVLFLMCVIFLFGAGRWSVDHYLEKKSAELTTAKTA